MKDNSMYFISGVSGVGKTSIIPFLKSALPLNFEVHDFDENGVPTGADHVWRINTTIEWIKLADKKSRGRITLIVCGISNPDEIQEIEKDFPNLHIVTILLDGNVEIVEQRLRSRNNRAEVKADLERVVGSAEAFIKDNSRFQVVLREICKKHKCTIIDTSYISPKEVSERVAELVK